MFTPRLGVTCAGPLLQRRPWMHVPQLCLGIESSCDDTAAAVVRRSDDGVVTILSNVVFGQSDLHASFGGVVPEIAARAHAEKIDVCVSQAMEQADTSLGDIDMIGVTAGPGLIGGVMAGVMCAKGLSAAGNIFAEAL